MQEASPCQFHTLESTSGNKWWDGLFRQYQGANKHGGNDPIAKQDPA